MHSKDTGCLYSPNCREGSFSETGLPVWGILRSSPQAVDSGIMPLVQRFGRHPRSGSERSAAVSAEDNEAIIRRWIEAYNDRDRQAEADLLAPGYVAHVPGAPGPLVGLEAWTQFSG
jgi:hypothetical protein